ACCAGTGIPRSPQSRWSSNRAQRCSGFADMGIVTFVAGLLLPCLLGIAVLAAIRDTTRSLAAPGEIAWIVGAGYLAGAFLLTLWMRVLSLAGIPFGAAVIGLPLALATVALAFVASRRHGGIATLAAFPSAMRA